MPATQRILRREDAPRPIDVTPDDAEALKETQLELLAEFDRVCRLHDLPYFALYGTLLGAARHQGFIPWDDDLDLGMLRPDYDRLVRLIDADLGEGFFFQTVESDPHYGYMFGKLRKDGTRYVDLDSYGSAQHPGVFIDIFPLDAKPTGGWRRLVQRVMRYVGFLMLYLKAGYLAAGGSTPWSRAYRTVSRVGIRVFPRRVLIAVSERYARLGATDSPRQYVSLFGGYFYDHDTVDAEWMLPVKEMPFEGTTIPVPADTHAYLTKIYGDYLQLPPVEQQVGRHEIVELALDS